MSKLLQNLLFKLKQETNLNNSRSFEQFRSAVAIHKHSFPRKNAKHKSFMTTLVNPLK